MQSTYVEETVTVENAREYGHTHLSEVVTISFLWIDIIFSTYEKH